MSHFSRIKTSIRSFDILQKTLTDLNFKYNCLTNDIRDSNGNLHKVDLVIENVNNINNLFGFSWDGYEYNLVADLQLWNQEIPVDRFMNKILQQYALNSILDSSIKEGFKEINKEINQDGSITLVMQRWN